MAPIRTKQTQPTPPEAKIPSTMKTCCACNNAMPATDVYFDLDASREDGLRQRCKDCRRKKSKGNMEKRVGAHARRLDKQTRNMLTLLASPDFSPDQVNGVPHIASVYEEITRLFGGAQGVAQHFMIQYLEAPAGGQIRQRMLDAYLRLANKVSDSGAAKKPLELWTEDELREFMERKRGELTQVQTIYVEREPSGPPLIEEAGHGTQAT
jgi:hypothetical protein